MWLSIQIGVILLASVVANCPPSVTKVSGTHAPTTICSGDLIFSDDFDYLDFEKWQHEITLAGGGNWEFQIYSNNRTNSFTKNGQLYIQPSLTSDQYGEEFLTSGVLNLEGGGPADTCTNPSSFGCERTGTPTNILNPIKSARLRTVNSFTFQYGRVEVRAKMPTGDWLWPAIWLMPAYNAYGTWPSSGEIDIAECRGNRNLMLDGENIGTQQIGATLHFGPYPEMNGFQQAHWTRQNATGYNNDFHRYQLEWTPDYIKISVDDVELGRAAPDKFGFWKYGGLDFNPKIQNPWRYGTKMAPFDQKFYLIFNVAAGGISGFFPDVAVNSPKPKPWSDDSEHAATEFWKAKKDWLPTWALDKNNGSSALRVDYVRIWSL